MFSQLSYGKPKSRSLNGKIKGFWQGFLCGKCKMHERMKNVRSEATTMKVM